MKLKNMLICAAAALLLLSGCSKKKEVSVDVNALAKELNEQTVTSDELTQAAQEMVPTIYNVDAASVTSACVYTNSGATSCEVGVIECSDDKAAGTVKSALEAHAASQE